MIITNQIHEKEVHLGINNKIIESLFVHPWGAFFLSYFSVALIIFFTSDINAVKQFSLVGLPICIVSIFIAIRYHKNSCFKLAVNMAKKEISFYMMFSRNIVVEDVNGIRIEIGREIVLIANQKKYKIFSEILHDVVSYLPYNTEIIYKGFFGKQFKKELEFFNKPLTPGKYY